MVALGSGTDIRALQELLGYKDVRTTVIGWQVMNGPGVGMRRSYRTPGLGWGGTQRVALGRYTVSRWDTGRRVGCVLLHKSSD